MQGNERKYCFMIGFTEINGIIGLSIVRCLLMLICLISPAFYAFTIKISPAFYAFTIKISPAFYKILLNVLDYQIFIVSLQKIINRGHNYDLLTLVTSGSGWKPVLLVTVGKCDSICLRIKIKSQLLAGSQYHNQL